MTGLLPLLLSLTVSLSAPAQARDDVVDRFTASFTYSDIHNLTRKTQVRELEWTSGAGTAPVRPPESNHDWEYVYGVEEHVAGGKWPHRATRVGSTVFGYDESGNTVLECETVPGAECGEEQGAGGEGKWRRYGWSEDNWLRSVTEAGAGAQTQFLYDASGERVVKLGRTGESITVGKFFTVKSGWYGAKHVFAGEGRVATRLVDLRTTREEEDLLRQASQLTRECDPLQGGLENCPDRLLATAESTSTAVQSGTLLPTTYYYHPDHLGSTAVVTDSAARVHERVEYFPYGEVWREGLPELGSTSDSPRQKFHYTGKEFDEETGLTYFGARYYDARRARWLSTDPALTEYLDHANRSDGLLKHHIYYPANLSLYSYGNHRPTVLRDPDGRVVPLAVALAAICVGGGCELMFAAAAVGATATLAILAAQIRNTYIQSTSSSGGKGDGEAGVRAEQPVASPVAGEADGIQTQPGAGAPALPDAVEGAAGESKRHNPDQQALRDLADSASKGGRVPRSADQADTILDWAKEYDYPGARATPNDVAGNHPGTQWDGKPHIHLPGAGRGGHVPVKPGVTPR